MSRKSIDIYEKTPTSIKAAWSLARKLWGDGVGCEGKEDFVSALKKFQETLPIYEHLVENHSIVKNLVPTKMLRESSVTTQEKFFNQELNTVRKIIEERRRIVSGEKLEIPKVQSKVSQPVKVTKETTPLGKRKGLPQGSTSKKQKKKVSKKKKTRSSEPDSKTEISQLSSEEYYVLFNNIQKRFSKTPPPNTEPIPAKYVNQNKNAKKKTPFCPTTLLIDTETREVVGCTFFHNRIPEKRHFFYGEKFENEFIFKSEMSKKRGQPLASSYIYVEFATRYTCRSSCIPEGAIRIPATYSSENAFKQFEKLSADLVSLEGKIVGRVMLSADYRQLEPLLRIYRYREKIFEFKAENFPNIMEEYAERGINCDSSMPPPPPQARYFLPAREGDQPLKDLKGLLKGNNLVYVEFKARYAGYYLGIPRGASIEPARCISVTIVNSNKRISVQDNKPNCLPLVSLNHEVIGKIITSFDFPRNEAAIKLYEYGEGPEKRLFELRRKDYENIITEIHERGIKTPYEKMSEESRGKMQFYTLGDRNSCSSKAIPVSQVATTSKISMTPEAYDPPSTPRDLPFVPIIPSTPTPLTPVSPLSCEVIPMFQVATPSDIPPSTPREDLPFVPIIPSTPMPLTPVSPLFSEFALENIEEPRGSAPSSLLEQIPAASVEKLPQGTAPVPDNLPTKVPISKNQYRFGYAPHVSEQPTLQDTTRLGFR